MNAKNLGVAALALICQLLSQPAAALAITDSSLSISNLSIMPVSGRVVFDGGLPTAFVFAQAANSQGELDAQFDVSHIEAHVTWADATADAAPAVGAVGATSAVNLPGFDNFGNSQGQGSLFGSFVITGGTGAVDVTFSMNLAGQLHGFADAVGSFETEVVATLEVDGGSVLFGRFELQGGPNYPDTTLPLSEFLTATLPLEFGVSYFLFVQADSESFARNIPEPGTLALALLGLAGLARKRGLPGCRVRQILRSA